MKSNQKRKKKSLKRFRHSDQNYWFAQAQVKAETKEEAGVVKKGVGEIVK